jgi:twinkle protein
MIYLDHLTALTADLEDERRGLDKMMADMASLAQELWVIIHFISHLTTPQGGASHEEGARVKERDFTGSRAIARWAHFLVGLERNKQHEDEVMRQVTTVRILKDRYTGQATGQTFYLRYDPKTGTMSEVPFQTEKEEVL